VVTTKIRAKAAALGAAVTLTAGLPACDQILGLTGDPTLRDAGHSPTCPVVSPDPAKLKLDIVFVIQNSRSMGDKEEILALAVPRLVERARNPLCFDADDLPLPAGKQPPTGTAACPPGSQRKLPASQDIHVGVISSSLGGHGSDACPALESFSCGGGAPNTSNNDQGHLISRADPCAPDPVPTYQGKGFLAWDPLQMDVPPGENDPDALSDGIGRLARGVGQVGCGYASQLESWYRFLVDPNPYQTITVDAQGLALPQGTDQALLQQRADFLRPDSLLWIIMLTVKNDCSIKESGQSYLVAQLRNPSNPNANFHLPRARQECAANPDDPCCKSCGEPRGSCPPDPMCESSPTLTDQEDDVNLRCWDQKRRFGIDFLYPVDRYVKALTSPEVPDRDGAMKPNPIFGGQRGCNMVLLTGIVGVPWQDVARQANDLGQGFMNADELSQKRAGGVTQWDIILGDPSNHEKPLDPHMIESNAPRQGTNPLTGDTLALPSAAPGPGPDNINGHEYTPGTDMGVQVVADDLEYACIFPVQKPIDCSVPSSFCDCNDPLNDNPLCEPDPSKGGNRTMQVRAQAYPGIRQLEVLRALGPQGVVASICPAQYTDEARADYAYQPAVEALARQAGSLLQKP
jgi:hypothetical protein